jgi:hypothetical protein
VPVRGFATMNRSVNRSGVPLVRQPPVYMLAAVVLASLVPLGLQLKRFPAATPPVETASAVSKVRAGFAAASGRLRPRTSVGASLLGEALQLGSADASESIRADSVEQDAEVIVIEDEDERSVPRLLSARGLLGKARRAFRSGRPGAAYRLAGQSARRRDSPEARAVQAKAACELRNKSAARTAYRELPLGRTRRDVRRRCRKSGILLL